MDDLTRFCLDVHEELTEMAKLGVSVPQSALDYALDREQMAELDNMSVGDAASLVLELRST